MKCFLYATLLTCTSGFAYEAYVSNVLSGTVSVIDTETNMVIKTLIVGGFPKRVIINPNQTQAYVMNGDGNISVINVLTNTVSTIPIGAPVADAAFSLDGKFAYVAANNGVFVINTANNAVTQLNSTPSMNNAVVSPNNQFAYLIQNNNPNAQMFIIDIASNTIIGSPITIDPMADALAIAPNNEKIYITSAGNESVQIIDIPGYATAADLTMLNEPQMTVITPDSSQAYISGGDGVINIVNDMIHMTISVGETTFMVFTLDGGTLYASNDVGSTVVPIDTQTNMGLTPITVGTHPQQIAITPDGKFLYVANSGSSNVSVIDIATSSVIATIPVDNDPQFVGIANPFQPPQSVVGKQIYNRFFTQSDIINRLRWQPPSTGTMPVQYNIYRNAALTDLAGSVPASTQEFLDHNRKKGAVYTYYIVSVDAFGQFSSAVELTVYP